MEMMPGMGGGVNPVEKKSAQEKLSNVAAETKLNELKEWVDAVRRSLQDNADTSAQEISFSQNVENLEEYLVGCDLPEGDKGRFRKEIEAQKKAMDINRTSYSGQSRY